MLEYIKTHHARRISGSSILMVADHISQKYECRIIDLATMEDFEDMKARDDGYILGIESLLKILKAF